MIRPGAFLSAGCSGGPGYLVRLVRQEVYYPDTNGPSDLRTNIVAKIYSKWWEQDYAQSIRTNYYHLGYPETTVTLQTERPIRGKRMW